ncbi:MAG: cytochrome c biogenesis protein [Bdellovibrionales bacterium]
MEVKKVLGLLLIFVTRVVFASSELQTLPVQDGGRIKPFDSFAREHLEIVYGKTKLEGRPAFEVIMTWMLTPEAWVDKEIFEIGHADVKKRLNLDPEKKLFKGQQIFDQPAFPELMVELRDKRDTKEKLTPYYQALQRLESQYFIFTEIAAGRMLKVLPVEGQENWVSVADLPEPFQAPFAEISKSFVGWIGAQVQGGDVKKASQALDESAKAFKAQVDQVKGSWDIQHGRLGIELHFNEFHPFRWSAVFYALSLLFFLLVWIVKKPGLRHAANALLGLGFLLHIYGFAVRVYLTGHPPVTNMYETVVWVAFGTIIFAGILTYYLKSQFIMLGGAMVATICMIIADNAPVILDDTIQPLEAVLRSNYWLTIHVLTITISYSAFFLAMALGDIGLIYYIRGEKKFQQEIKELAQSVYRSMQIGLAFLIPGIILGGIWADYSWGRFWGWDPKETWALIAALGYLAALHARLVGLVRDFGMLASGVAAFSLVIMAWYGVNFVLGAGLHSYGFGAGGIEYVSVFVLLHFLLIGYAWLVRRELQKTQ